MAIRLISSTANGAIQLLPNGTGQVVLGNANLTLPVSIKNGTASQHTTLFQMANTAASRTVIFPDLDGTLLLNAGANTMASTASIVMGKANGTEAANAVTASAQSGVITTSSLTTAAASSYAITWTNTFISATSSIQLTLMGGTNTVKNITLEATAGAGTSTLTIYNNSAATALDGTILIGYFIA